MRIRPLSVVGLTPGATICSPYVFVSVGVPAGSSCHRLRQPFVVLKGEHKVGGFLGLARRAEDGAAVLSQNFEPQADLVRVPHGQRDGEPRSDKGARHFAFSSSRA